MSTDAAHRQWWQIFEVVFGIPVLFAIALQYALPLSLPPAFRMPAIILGIAFIITGLVFVVLARRQFAHHQQPTDPGRPTSRIITTSVFSISRNPLYLGGICVVLGIALAFNLVWLLVFLVPALFVCRSLLVVPEERYLERTFGEDTECTWPRSIAGSVARGHRKGSTAFQAYVNVPIICDKHEF